MARVSPLSRDDLSQHEPGWALVEEVMGFIPNSMFTMARVPGLLESFQALAGTVFSNGLLSRELTQMVALMASTGGQCRYCQAHTGHSAEKLGVSAEKLAAIWEFETSDLFDDAERVALRLAFHAGQVPNAATDEDFEAARKHYSDDQLAAIVATCSLFGYLNRWNDTMATDLEDSPKAFAQRTLGDKGWEAGKHAG